MLSLSLLACGHEELVEATEERLTSGACLSGEELLATSSSLHEAQLVGARLNDSPPLCFYPAELVLPSSDRQPDAGVESSPSVDAAEHGGEETAEEEADAPTVAEWQRAYAQQCTERASHFVDGRDGVLADPYVSHHGVFCTPAGIFFYEQASGGSCSETAEGLGSYGLSLGPLLEQATQTYFECTYDVVREKFSPGGGCRGMPLGNGL